MNGTQPTPVGRRLSIIALALGTVSIFVAGLTLALDKSLPYRISSSHYVQYLWVGRLSGVSLVTSVAAILLSIASRRRLPSFLGLVSLVSLMFIGGVHSGPNPKAWCVSNLRNIEIAKQQVAEKIGLTDGAVVTAEQISKYITGGFNSLRCAEGGQYIIGTAGTESRCSLHGSRSEIEAGWEQESLKYLGRTGATVIGTNYGK
jgi:hypothetical protein